MVDYVFKIGIICIGILLSLIVSSILIKFGIPWVKKVQGPEPAPPPVQENNTDSLSHKKYFPDLGFLIGFFETLIIFIFVVNKEFSALAIIFGAKEFVRKEQIKADPTYYLLGTFINFAIALIMSELSLAAIKLMF